jgi:spermidine synthase
MIHFLFFLSGLSGLIYQVVWVRMFGNVFGNTIYSASIVIAVFMLGLGVGSYLAGAWADRRYARIAAGEAAPNHLLRTYGVFELTIAALGLWIALVLPHLGAVSAMVSSYVQEPSGWYAPSAGSYVARTAIAIALMAPITLLMGGTLTLLIRHLVRHDLAMGGWRIAALYAVNTAGAASGAFVTDFALVPGFGLLATQGVAVLCNVVAGLGALWLTQPRDVREPRKTASKRRPARPADAAAPVRPQLDRSVALTAVAMAMTGFAALGMEILWFRHFSMLLGGFRAVFSLLLTLILAGIAIGSLVGGLLDRRSHRPAEWFMAVQALFVGFTLLGLAIADVDVINAPGDAAAAGGAAVASVALLEELWFNAAPMLMEVAIPAFLMGFSFPLANAIVQRAEQTVGGRAGILYLANTAGAVGGSLAAGFLLLPALGLQSSATILMASAALAILPLQLGARPAARVFVSSITVAGLALGAWWWLPSDYIIQRALGTPNPGENRIVVSDGLTELIAVTEAPGKGRTLVTNGHAMSSTLPLSQRYMRALAHIPLLSLEQPRDVLVIGFGVGNTTHAATLHPSVRRVELADLSRDILDHASYFADGNKGVLADAKVRVYINDGRQHLQMQPPAAYDLVVLEPPPIAYAGVGALYSRDFYALARTRLRAGGYVSQWLPTYQVPSDTALAMVRAFVDVFPASVLLSGSGNDLILLGVNGPGIEIDPGRVQESLTGAPLVREDLERIDLDALYEIVGTFVGSGQRLADATRGATPVVDDRPLQEYGVRSMLNYGYGVPGALVNLSEVTAWCGRCFVDGRPIPAVDRLDAYLKLLDLAYSASSAQVADAQRRSEAGRTLMGSRYLGAIVPESAETYNVLGIALAERGQLDAAADQFRRALQLDPDNPLSHWHLGAALASRGAHAEAADHLARAVALDPSNSRAQGDLGLVLAMQGRLDEAAGHLERALALDPQAEDVRRNLSLLRQRLGRE